MNSGLAKRDNRIATLILFIQAFDILLNSVEADTWIQHITNYKGALTSSMGRRILS